MKSETLPVEKKSMHTMLFLILNPSTGFVSFAFTIVGCARLVLEVLAKEEKVKKDNMALFC